MDGEWLKGKVVLAVLVVLMSMLFTGAAYASEDLDLRIFESPGGDMGNMMRCQGGMMHDTSNCHGMSKCEQDHTKCATEIPEFPTVAIPAMLALGGYLAIRARRRKE